MSSPAPAITLLVSALLLVGVVQDSSHARQTPSKKSVSPSQESVQQKVARNLAEDADDEESITDLFALGDEAVPSLIKFLTDPDQGKRAVAARGLAYIGSEQGIQAVRTATGAEKNKEAQAAMSCFLAGALVQSQSESDLDFLKSLVEGARFTDDDDESDFPASCAALTLGMMGRRDSLPVLRKVAGAELFDSEEVEKAILWIENKSALDPARVGLASDDQESIKRFVLDKTFFAERERDKTSADQLTFNRARNRVLVSVEIYLGPKSARGYHVELAKENSVWRIVGIWFAWIA